MEADKQFEAIRAPSRNRSKMGGEDDLNCLGEAQLLARLAENARRLEIIERFRRDLFICSNNFFTSSSLSFLSRGP